MRQTVGLPTACVFSDRLFTVFYQPAEIELHIVTGNNGIEEIGFPSEILAGKNIPDLQGITGSNRESEVHHFKMDDGFSIGQIDVCQRKLAAGQVTEKGIR